MVEIEKNKYFLKKKLQPSGYPNMAKSKIYLLSPFWEKYDYFWAYMDNFWEKRVRGYKSQDQNQSVTYPFHSHNSGKSYYQKSFIPTFSSFAAISTKVHFSKILSRIFKFGCFSRYHAQVFDENMSQFLMQNLMLNRLAPIGNSKNKNQKGSYLHSNCSF